jgi:hypothetical protein
VVVLGFFVAIDTTTINNAEIRTIGTTGMKPNTAVPPGVLDKTSTPPGAQRIVAGPGAGAGTTSCKIATNATASATQTVDASAPYFVLPFQNNAAIKSGDNAAKPENPYWIASSKIDSGARRAIA